MKRTLIMFLFAFYSMLLFAPNVKTILYIPRSESITYIESNYDSLIDAISWYESKNIDSAFNKLESACGRLQIRPCRLEHYNQLTGKNYTLNDMYNFKIAREVFLYFTDHDARGRKIPKKSWELAAKNWNGSGPRTETYWANISALI